MKRHGERLQAIEWTLALYAHAKENAPQVAMENPVGVLSIKASQYVQPYQFGHPESKKTGLWLHNLPKLTPTNTLPRPDCGYWDNQTPSGQNKLGPSADRWKIRSETMLNRILYPAIGVLLGLITYTALIGLIWRI
jgi:hypothetical protein